MREYIPQQRRRAVGNGGPDFDANRAEFFEALGHPTRIRILRALEGGPLGFSELKHSVGVESNGLLAFHLGKLAGFVKENPDGKYAISDYGVEALRVSSILVSSEVSDLKPLKVSRRLRRSGNWLPLVAVVLAIALIVTAVFAGIVYTQNSVQESQIMALEGTVGVKNTSIAGLQSNLTILDGAITSLNNELATLRSNQSASRSQIQALELRASTLENSSAQLQLEMSVLEHIGKLAVQTFYVNDTMIVGTNSTVFLASDAGGSNGTIVFVSPNGCSNAGDESMFVQNQYVLTILLLPGSNSTTRGGLTSAYVGIDGQSFSVYFRNVGALPAQCIFSLFYVYYYNYLV